MVWDQNSRKMATQNPTGINLTNTLDPLGNRLVLQDNYGSTTYTWDSQSRLLSIWNPYNERTTMSYDPLDRDCQ
jgi:YD repeat-containing protein